MKKGFTLIEVVIVIAVISLIVPLFISIFFNLSRMQIQLSILQELKEQGDFVQEQIVNTVRNSAALIDSTCNNIPEMPLTDQTQICFYDRNNIAFGFSVDASAQVASYSASMATPIYLLDNSAVQYPIRIMAPSFTAIDSRTAAFSYTVQYTPVVNFLPQQSLTYQFYTHLRN